MGNSRRAGFRVAIWNDAPQSWTPAVVLIAEKGTLATILIVDDPDLQTGAGLFLIPAADVARYFTISNAMLCPQEFQNEFNIVQQYLIEKELPMMGPLFYLRTATLLKYHGCDCAQAIAKNKEIEAAMMAWVLEGSKIISAMRMAA